MQTAFINSLTDLTQNVVSNYAEIISKKYNIDLTELLEIWNDKNTNVLSSVGKTPHAITSVPKVSKTSSSRTTGKKSPTVADSSTSNTKTCTYVAVRGASKGVPCGATCTDSTDFCKKHLVLGEKQKTSPKKIKEKTKTEVVAPVISKMRETQSVQTIRRNEYGNYTCVNTNFVFRKEDKHVIGKQVEDKIVMLTAEDIDTCKSLGYMYVVPDVIETDENQDEYEEVIEYQEIEEEVDEEEEAD